MLKTTNVSKSFGGIHAVDNCSCRVEQNRITGLIGPNGAGKTTLFDLITGFINADRGSITFMNQDITNKETHTIANRGISRTFQQVRLFKHLTIREHLYMAMDNEDTPLFKNIFRSSKDTEKERQAQQVLERVGLKKSLDTYAHNLSYGQRKLLDLAMALVKPHKFLMLDEPVAGVNPFVRQEIKKILLSLKKQGATVLVIEHDMDFVMDICDTIIVLDAGKVLKEGRPKEIQNDKKVLEAYLGESHA